MSDNNKIQANSIDNNKIQASLTEQLYAGTLPTGHYYFNNGVETYIVLYKNINSKHLILQEPEGIEVLCKVPSYEEWKAQQNYEEHQKKCISIYENKEKQHTDDAIAYNELKAENESLKADRENYIELCERLLTISEKEWENLVKTGSRKQQLEWLNSHTKTSFINLLNLYECQKEDCHTLAQKLLQVKPELRDWLDVNFKEYL